MKSIAWVPALVCGLLVAAGTAWADFPGAGPGAGPGLGCTHGCKQACCKQACCVDAGARGKGACGPMACCERGPHGPRMRHGMGLRPRGMGPLGPGMRQGGGLQGPMGCGGFGRGAGPGARPGQRMLEDLDLSRVQREELAEIRDRAMEENIRAGADLRIAELELRKLLRAESPDREAIEAQIDRIAGLRASIRKARTAALLQGRDVLTPEQREKIGELREGLRLRGWPGTDDPDAPPAPPGGDDE